MTIEILKEKIARIQQELADVSAGLDEITKTAAPPAARSHPRANRPCVDKEPLRQTLPPCSSAWASNMSSPSARKSCKS